MKSKAVLLVILLLGLVPLLWFRDGYLIAGGDAFSLLNPGAFADAFKYVWNEKLPNAGGMIFSVPRLIPMIYFWTALSSLRIPLVFVERLWILLLFALPSFSMYFLISTIYNRPLAKLVSSVFYTFNLFVLVSGPFHDNLRLVFIALPITLAFWIKGLQCQTRSVLRYSVLIGLVSLIYSNANVNPPTVVVIPLTLSLYFLFHSLAQRKITQPNLVFLLSSVFSYLVLNSWWILNFVFGILQEVDAIRKVATFTALGTGGITDFFRLLGSWGWRAEHYRMPYYPYARFYDEPILLFLSFLVPFLVFSTLLSKRVGFQVRFFGFLALVGLFLSKGTAEPFGFVYRWIWENVPGFWVFREPFSKFSPITMFAYSVLIGLAADFIYLKMINVGIMRGARIRFLISVLLPMFLISTFLIVAYPLVTGEVIWNHWNGSVRSYFVKIPDYWKEISGWFSNNGGDQRIFLTPRGGYGVAYNWPSGFSSADAPSVVLLDNPVLRTSSPMSLADGIVEMSYGSMRLGNQREFTRLLSLLSVRYILQENDLDWRYTAAALPPSESNNFLLSGGFNKVVEFGSFDRGYLSSLSNEETRKFLRDNLGQELEGRAALVLYQAPEKDYLPRFYVPERVIYSSGDLEALRGVVSLDDYYQRSAVYLSNLGNFPDDGAQLVEAPNYVFVKPEKIEFAEDVRLSLEDEEKFVLPKTSILPDSPLYFLIKLREGEAIRKQKEKIPRTDILLWLSTKRLLEMERMVGFGRYRAVNETFERYMQQVKEVVSNLQILSREQASSYHLAAKANLFFAKHKDMLERLRGGLSAVDSEQRITEIYDLFREVSFIVSRRNSQFYLVNEPKPGYYRMMVRGHSTYSDDLSEKFLGQLDLVFDKGEKRTLLGQRLGEGWYEYPEMFLSSGSHDIYFPSVRTEPIIDSESSIGDTDSEFVPDAIEGNVSLKMVADKYQVKEINWVINDLRPGASYRVVFNYKTLLGSPLRLSVASERVYQARRDGSLDAGKFPATFDLELKRDMVWQTFDRVFAWESLERDGRLSFSLTSFNTKSVSLINHLRVERIQGLDVLLKSETGKPLSRDLPKIQFYRENPTKYRVRVRGASAPYTLVFSESFHKGWKVYLVEPNSFESSLKKSGAYANSRSYFAGEIKEIKTNESFLNSSTFETWGKRPIGENRHTIVNGYANSWYLLASDVGGKSDYDLVVEFWPQRVFYIGLVVSLVGTLLVTGYVAFNLLRGK